MLPVPQCYRLSGHALATKACAAMLGQSWENPLGPMHPAVALTNRPRFLESPCPSLPAGGGFKVLGRSRPFDSAGILRQRQEVEKLAALTATRCM